VSAAARRLNVFVNVPFDDAFEPLFEALIFAISACGYRARCALEGSDSGDIRLDKLIELIRESSSSIHDLSRTELGDNELPRFNMPFELGMAMGAKRFGRRPKDRIKIMVDEPYRLPAYLSDLGGNDPDAHGNDPNRIIRIVRNFLQRSPRDEVLPGPARLAADFQRFRARLPAIATEIGFLPEEVRGFGDYPTFAWCVNTFLTEPAEAGE
jgi:hypothetical protein